MLRADYEIASLNWKSIKYGEEEIEDVPNDKRGVYAFAVCNENGILPPHGYIVYMGIAGRGSNRPLRARYRDYLNPRSFAKRDHIVRMIITWEETLRFFFAPVDDSLSTEDLQSLEKKLNSALVPPFSKGDLEAETKQYMRMYR